MPADIFGRRVHGDVDAMIECAKAEWRRPRIVENEPRAARVGNRCDRRHVLHVERQRPWRLGEYDSRIGTKIALDRGAGMRIVVTDVNAQALQMVFAKAACRPVHDVGDEHMIAGLGQCEERQRRRGKPRRHRERREAAFKRRHCALKIDHRRQSMQSVRQARVPT